VLSYIFVILPRKIPGQNEWIAALHARGVQDHETFWPLFVLSTLGMSSGLSLGPELPLVLTAGMVGSWLGVISKQSMLQARVMNLTAASAAVGGFFGFPMAGAMFVLEIPHRMGLQYFEALSPATIASIFAVLVNRMIVNNDVTGYYNYPFLTSTLPSHIFTTAIVYGLVGSAIGVIYAESVMFLKHVVHDLFNAHHHHGHDHGENEQDHENESLNDLEKTKLASAGVHQNGNIEETIPLVVHMDSEHDFKFGAHRSENLFERIGAFTKKVLSCGIKHEPTRAAVAGTLAGLVVGITCMFVPHVTFWGEAQLQTLIDKGRTPLPVFGEEHKSTIDLTAYGYCLINPKDASEVAAGFSIGCAALITSAKIFVTGLSLGTGIIGGHFWGPLFVGCAASHLLTDLANLMQRNLGFGEGLAAYPCVSILCMMGSTHVVTFRAHMAIMLILTLTISAFDQGDSSGTGYTAGDYSAVFPLLVVSVFVSLMISRGTVFYAAQRSRGDIMALPQVLCEPGKEGAPLIIDYDEGTYFSSRYDQNGHGSASWTSAEEEDTVSTAEHKRRMRNANVKQDDIEKEFMEQQQRVAMTRSDSESSTKIRKTSSSSHHRIPEPDIPFLPKEEIEGPPILPPSSRPHKAVPDGRSSTVSVAHDVHPSIERDNASAEDFVMPLLDKPMEPRFRPPRKGHRRIHSAPDGNWVTTDQGSPTSLTSGPTRSSPRHRRTSSTASSGGALRERSGSAASGRAGAPTAGLKKISSYGEVSDFQPSLLELILVCVDCWLQLVAA
jgi:H+/Cl- antiporter ClcA